MNLIPKGLYKRVASDKGLLEGKLGQKNSKKRFFAVFRVIVYKQRCFYSIFTILTPDYLSLRRFYK